MNSSKYSKTNPSGNGMNVQPQNTLVIIKTENNYDKDYKVFLRLQNLKQYNREKSHCEDCQLQLIHIIPIRAET